MSVPPKLSTHDEKKISSPEFYREYYGHQIDHLEQIFETLVASRRRNGEVVRVIFLAGDSSMDNKHWIPREYIAACNGYEDVLSPPRFVADIAAHINTAIATDGVAVRHPVACSDSGNAGSNEDRSEAGQSVEASARRCATRTVCINAAVEESTISMRAKGSRLLPQDAFIRDRVTEDDVIIVSVGGNDVALKPTLRTILAMGWLTRFSFYKNIVGGSAWGLDTMCKLCCVDVMGYFRALTSVRPAGLLIPAVIYYPDMNSNAPSWANVVLKAIGYNKDPKRVHAVIDRIFLKTQSRLGEKNADEWMPRVRRCVPVAMSRVLDGRCSEDYVARVEPSVQGGRKLASFFLQKIADEFFV